MTVNEIRDFVISVDPDAQHYASDKKGEAYTVWREIRLLPTMADDVPDEAWAFQIDRFTKDEHDPIAAALMSALIADDRIACAPTVDYERDSGYIHHIFDCEGI